MDAQTNRLFVKNFTDRTLTAIDLGNLFNTGDITTQSQQISTVSSETLNSQVRLGKQIFYHASDPRMSAEGYLSCATCHVDGGSDGRVWDFTGRGEGLRNTITLRGRQGTAHGNVHWSGNFDEIQDFEEDIRNAFGGSGFLTNTDFTNTSNPLGTPKAGLNADLDALAAYVSSLDQSHIPRSPYRNPDGTLTAEALQGEALFVSLNCVSCHSGPRFTDSSLGAETLHDVGTLRTTSGERLSAPLDGIDTPSLLGVWNTAPFFHDGSAATLEEVFSVAGGEVIPAEQGVVSAANASIVNTYVEINNDDTVRNRAFVSLDNNGTVTLSNVDGGSGGSGAIELRYSSDSYNPSSSAELRVNGVLTTFNLPNVGNLPPWRHTNWLTLQIENINLTAGPTNSIEIRSTSASRISIDEVLINRSDQLNLAQPHRQVSALSANDFNDLLAYLRQLDGTSNNPGSGGTDTDGDGIPDTSDPDDDNDGLSDLFEQSIGTDPLLVDTDGDGLSDFDEVNYDGDPGSYSPGQDLDPLSTDTDSDGIADSTDPIPLTFNHNDGDLAPLASPDGVINVADLLIAQRIVLGQLQASNTALAHGDLYPPAAPDGVIDLSDLLLIQQLVLTPAVNSVTITIDFETTSFGSYTSITDQGFSFENNGTGLDVLDASGGSTGSTHYLRNSGWAETLTLTRTDSGAFELSSFDYQGLWDNGTATVTGYKTDSSVLSDSFSYTASTPLTSKTLNWTNLQRVEISFDSYTLMDNFIVTTQ